MDLVPIVEIVEFDGAAIVAGAVVQAARVKDSFASTVVVIVSTNVAVDLVDGAFVKLHAGLLFDPIFELDVRGLIVLDVIEGFLDDVQYLLLHQPRLIANANYQVSLCHTPSG